MFINKSISYFTAISIIITTIMSCTKDEPIPLPEVTTKIVSDISYTIAKSGGIVVSDGGSSVTARGVCWSLNASPTINDNKTTDGAGGGSFSSSITGLAPNSTYFIRAYATSAKGTGYGISLSFTTLPAELAKLSTSTASNITPNSATVAGSIASDGGAPVTERGICWNSNPSPTIVNSKSIEGGGIGGFTSNLTSLISGQKYYARAYATNSIGTVYGNEISFTTPSLPTVTTSATQVISITSVRIGATLVSNGSAQITSFGFCWGTNFNPTINDNIVNSSVGVIAFNSIINGLPIGVTYHGRAFSTNTVGTSYGNDVTFTIPTPTISAGPTDIDGNVYTSVNIGNQVWLVENLKTTKLNDGTPIQLVVDNTAWNQLTTLGYCWYSNDPLANKNTYGALYNWYAVNTGKLCPVGWHVPTDFLNDTSISEWQILQDYLDGRSLAAGRLKETGLSHWQTPNTAATNISKFTGLPGGFRTSAGFDSIFLTGFFWSSTKDDSFTFQSYYRTHRNS